MLENLFHIPYLVVIDARYSGRSQTRTSLNLSRGRSNVNQRDYGRYGKNNNRHTNGYHSSVSQNRKDERLPSSSSSDTIKKKTKRSRSFLTMV